MQPGTRPSDWPARLVRHHLPLALASAAVLVLFMTLPPFDANVYPHADLSSGAFPMARQAADRAPTDQGAGPTRSPGHGGDQTAPPGHGAGQTASPDHGRSQSASPGHGASPTAQPAHGSQTGATDQSGGQASRSSERMSDSVLGLSTRRFSVATGYVATGLLALTLLIGPANLLLRRRNPVSSYLRRDAGAWTAIYSVVHVFYGLQVHDRLANFANYFIARDGSPLTNSFGVANWTGLAATVIVVGLLSLSSDLALRTLRAPRWKWLQRLNYTLFALVVVHAFFYGALVRMTSPYTLLLGLSVIAVLVGQVLGVWLWRRRHSRPSPTLA